VLEDASVALNPNQANYITTCMESIKGILRKGMKKHRRKAKECFLPWRISPSGPSHPHYRGFTITLRHATGGRTPLDE
jgi:hypothetical protein